MQNNPPKPDLFALNCLAPGEAGTWERSYTTESELAENTACPLPHPDTLTCSPDCKAWATKPTKFDKHGNAVAVRATCNANPNYPRCIGVIRIAEAAPITSPNQTPHRCHVKGCTKIVPLKMLMCAPHWHLCPADLQRQVWRTYKAFQEVTKTPTAEYLAAAAAACAAVEARQKGSA